jgi:hypothetical protein
MNLKPIHYFLGGVALTALIAAAKFVGGTPLDQTFTYQGQLRNAGQLVSGPVDLKISMWDADTGGSQVGSTNTFNAMQLNDGRFACGLNFGNAAFDGSNRWIQVEFRNPAGSGQYLALSPRDKITATPYALYALNGANGVWVYDTNQQSVSVMGKKVGIGTSNPTGVLEVVSATGGDDSVKLPAGSIGASEMETGLIAGGVFAPMTLQVASQATATVEKTFSLPVSGTLVLSWNAKVLTYNGTLNTVIRFDGVPVIAAGAFSSGQYATAIELGAGNHVVSMAVTNQSDIGFPSASVSLGASVVLVQSQLSWD